MDTHHQNAGGDHRPGGAEAFDKQSNPESSEGQLLCARPRRRTTLQRAGRACLLGLVAVALAACGDDDSDSGNGSSGSGTSATSDGSYEAVGEFLGIEPGKAADKSKSPITLGFTNTAGGIFPAPQLGDAANAAVEMLNEHFGGVQGHPIKLKPCLVTSTEQEGQACGQQFANDDSITAVVEGILVIGSTSLHKAVGPKKPVFGGFAFPNEANLPNGFFTTGGPLSGPPVLTWMAQEVDADTLAYPYQGDPAGRQAAAAASKGLGQLGVKVKEATYPPGATDLTSAVVASGARDAGLLFASAVSTPACLAFAKAIEQLSIQTPVFALATCAEDQGIEEQLGDIPAWHYQWPTLNSLAPELDPSGQIEDYNAAIGEYVEEPAPNQSFATTTFQAVLQLAKLYNAAGADATPDEITAQAKKYAGPVFLGPDEARWGVPPFPSVLYLTSRVYKYEGDGKWTDFTEGKWVPEGPPPGGAPPSGEQ